MKYKITYFDRDSSSISSRTSLSRAQKRRMLNDLFGGQQYVPKQDEEVFEDMGSDAQT